MGLQDVLTLTCATLVRAAKVWHLLAVSEFVYHLGRPIESVSSLPFWPLPRCFPLGIIYCPSCWQRGFCMNCVCLSSTGRLLAPPHNPTHNGTQAARNSRVSIRKSLILKCIFRKVVPNKPALKTNKQTRQTKKTIWDLISNDTSIQQCITLMLL